MAGRISVLLVDDEPTLAKLYGTAVQRRGLNALATTDPEDALDIITRHRPKLIISDIQMPGLSGVDLCGRVEATGSKSGPFVFLTGREDEAILRQGLAAGGDEFIAKGGPIAHLLSRIEFWLQSGFAGLPRAARQMLLDGAGRPDTALTLGLQAEDRLDDDLVDAVAQEVMAEARALGSDFGVRLVERIAILGRVDGLLAAMANGWGVYLYFADYVQAVVNRLDFVWTGDAPLLFRRYGSLADDPRFTAARQGLTAL